MKLTHPTFGTGTLISDNDGVVTINFEGVEKKMVSEFAGLVKEDGQPFYIEPTKPVNKYRKSGTQKSRRQKDAEAIAAFNAMPNIDKIKDSILSINGKVQGDRNSLGYQLISERLAGIYVVAKEKNNQFIIDVINSIEKHMKASEKQAYVVARFADENGITY